MLGMERANREIKLIKSPTKMNPARARMGLPVPVTSRHILLLGAPVPAKPGAGVHQAAVQIDRAAHAAGGGDQPRQAAGPLYGRCGEEHLGDACGAVGGAVLFDEMHTLHERGYRQGDPYGNAIINTLLLYMENHRDELVVFGAGHAKAMDRMLEVNPGPRRRFSTGWSSTATPRRT
jgi:hypothetical protein